MDIIYKRFKEKLTILCKCTENVQMYYGVRKDLWNNSWWR